MYSVEIENLSFSYPGSDEKQLNKINLKIKRGDFVAIVGSNGCGKSTLCKCIIGLIPNFTSGDYSGRVLVEGLITEEEDLATLSREVGYVYQDFENQIVRPTVLEDASYSCMNFGMEDYEDRGMAALRDCGIDHLSDEFVWQLSGGQTHLLALAGTLSLSPDILILDEPIAQLDPKNSDNIYKVLDHLNKDLGKTIIVIEHHSEYIAEYCNNIIMMDKGEILWEKPVDEALLMVEDLMESDIYPPQHTILAHKYDSMDKFPKDKNYPIKLEEACQLFKDFTYLPDQEEKTKDKEKSNLIAELDGVTTAYRQIDGDKLVFEDLNLNIYSGEKIALVGNNGAGKSTLLKLLVGLVKPIEGRVILDGQSTRDLKADKMSNLVSLVFQDPEQMFIMDDIEADISYSMLARNLENAKDRTDYLIDLFNLEEVRKRDGRLLSGGQMRRASLAIGVALKPSLLLLDEPTSNLDMATRKGITRVLKEMEEDISTVIIASHDMQLVCEWADRVIVLNDARVIGDGPVDEIFSDRYLLEEAGIRPPSIFKLGKSIDKRANIYSTSQFIDSFEVDYGQ